MGVNSLNMNRAYSLSTSMIVRSLDANKDPFRAQEKNKEIHCFEIPYLRYLVQ